MNCVIVKFGVILILVIFDGFFSSVGFSDLLMNVYSFFVNVVNLIDFVLVLENNRILFGV